MAYMNMKKSTIITALTTIMMMAVTPAFAQEENGFKKFNVRVQAEFNALAAEYRAEIMQMRRDRNREGLLVLQDKLAAQAESKVGKSGLTDEQLKIYSTVGGTPHLDGQYTVFGEVEEGLDVVEMIQGTAIGRADRPVDDIEMRMTIIE